VTGPALPAAPALLDSRTNWIERVDHALEGLHTAPADEREAESREARALIGEARAKGEHIEVFERVQRVLGPARLVEDAIAGADLVRSAVLPREAAAREDVEELLAAAVRVCRRRPPAGRHLDAANANASTAGGLAEERPR
jgi:hypothetical protein